MPLRQRRASPNPTIPAVPPVSPADPQLSPPWKQWKGILALTSMICLSILVYLFQYADVPIKELEKEGPLHRSSCHHHLEDCRTTAPFVFDSVLSLLKQWPNSYASNGHSIVAATVPPHTLLYQARPVGGPPKVPAFFALDAEMSLGICGGSGTPVLHTMTTTRPLRVLYFDGQSALLTALGTLDAQMALLKSEVPPHPSESLVYDEEPRARDFCALIDEELGLIVDGIARMNAGFEVMLCDYTSAGVIQLYSTNVTVPGNQAREADTTLPRDPNRAAPYGFGNDFAAQNSREWIRSGTWHYGASTHTDGGTATESRIQLDLCGYLSFYDPYLRSLSGHHHGGVREGDKYQNGWGLRRGHRLISISGEDISVVKGWLKRITSPRTCSGIQWQALTKVIANHHRTRAREIATTIRETRLEETSLRSQRFMNLVMPFVPLS